MTPPTDLQNAIRDAILANPDADDKQIARIVFSTTHPGEEYTRKSSPSPQYVARRRGHIAQETRSPEIEVTGEPIPEPPTIEEIDTEPVILPPQEEPLTTPTQPSLFDGKQIVKVSFDGIAAFAGWEGWKLDPKDEADAQFMEATDRMITKYGPGFIEQWGDEVMFLISAGSTVGPRIRDYKKHLDDQKPKLPPEPVKTETKTAPEKTEISPSEPPSEEPHSIGDDQFKKRLGGQLR